MKKYFIHLSAIMATLLTAGCCVCPPEIPENTVLLDVRTPEEYSQRRIPGSILIPHDRINDSVTTALTDKNQAITVFCRSGRRSAIAKKKLEKLGFKHIYDLGAIDNAAKVLKREITPR